MVECPSCDKTTDTEHGMKIHHATIHNESLTFNDYECDWCGDSFKKQESQVSDYENTFCSNECQGKWMESELDSEDHPQWSGNRVKVSCDYCGTTVTKYQNKIDEQENVFCSRDCHVEYSTEHFADSRPFTRDGGTVKVECEMCSDVVTRNQWHIDNTEHNFCSSDCQGQWYSAYQNGEDHPLWIEDSDTVYYGDNWVEQREKALERDSFQCRDCDLDRDGHYDRYGFDLEVHHKNPIRTFDTPEDANTADNLITVCRKCHGKREAQITV